MNRNTVKKKFKHPTTGKAVSDVHVNEKGIYRWNSAYKVYNSIENYAQLQLKDVEHISWELSN